MAYVYDLLTLMPEGVAAALRMLQILLIALELPRMISNGLSTGVVWPAQLAHDPFRVAVLLTSTALEPACSATRCKANSQEGNDPNCATADGPDRPHAQPTTAVPSAIDDTLRRIACLLARMEVRRLTRRSQRGVATKRTLVWIMLVAFVSIVVGVLQAR